MQTHAQRSRAAIIWQPDISTLLNHADCREKNGQFATAWRLFVDAEGQTNTDPALLQLNTVAATRASNLQARLSKLSIDVAPAYRLDGLEILRDANLVEPGLWNHLQPIDGGTYRITARAPGRVTWSTTVIVNPEGDVQVVAVPELDLPTVPIAPEPKPDQRLPAPPNAASPSATLPIVTPPIATPLKAKPVPERLQTKVPVGKPLSEGLALSLSFGGTIVSYGVLVGTRYLASSIGSASVLLVISGGFGAMFAPSFGHWYAGKSRPRGLWIRTAGLVISLGGIASMISDEGNQGLNGPILLGAGFFLVGTLDDIITAPSRARRYNRDRNLLIAPLVIRRSVGLSFAGWF